MMNSDKKPYQEAFVWIWLPETTTPVVAGKLTRQGKSLVFNYGKSYLAREDAIAIYDYELPLIPGFLPLLPGMNMPGCIRDASPDAWGRRVMINKRFGHFGNNPDIHQIDELTYLLESESDRIGALDFQLSPTTYEARISVKATLDELQEAAMCVEKGIPLSPHLNEVLNHGTSIGGARPKALIDDHDTKYIAKFSSYTDLFSIVKAEFIAMRLAKLAGLNVASVSLTSSSNKDVLLIKRFDRELSKSGWHRKAMVSALTLLQFDEMMARYASYKNLAELIRFRFTHASLTLKELFGRITFNILVGNTDDHARNYAAFWDGKMLTLTPGYDICPQSRMGKEASQGMLITNNNRMSKLSVCLETAHIYLLSEKEALSIIEHQISTIVTKWRSVCEEAQLNKIDQRFMVGRQFFNPFAFEGLKNESLYLKKIANYIFDCL